jgi:hypothetical protein
MSTIYTKDGKPLNRSGNDLFDSSGRNVARISGDKAYSPRGRYVGTLVGDTLVYRSTDSASIGSSVAPSAGSATAAAPRAGSAIWGEEPQFDP